MIEDEGGIANSLLPSSYLNTYLLSYFTLFFHIDFTKFN